MRMWYCKAGGVDHPGNVWHLKQCLDGSLPGRPLPGTLTSSLLLLMLPLTMLRRSQGTISSVNFGKFKKVRERLPLPPNAQQIEEEEVSLHVHSLIPTPVTPIVRISSFVHLKRVTAWIFRFIQNSQV